MTTSHEVLETLFHTTRLRPGYSVDDVDDLLDGCRATLAHYETGGTAAAVLLTKPTGPTTPPGLTMSPGLTTTPGSGPLLTAAEVRSVRLPTTRWREGYVMEEVDDLLDDIVNELVRWETVAR